MKRKGVRAAARAAGKDESTVRYHARRGAVPVEADGTLDPAKVAAVITGRTRARAPAGSIAAARRRKLMARLADALDDLEALRRSAAETAQLEVAFRAVADLIAARFARLVADVAGKVAGEAEPHRIARLMEDEIRAALAEIAGTPVLPSAPAKTIARPKLARMDEARLEALKIEIDAERIEIDRALRRGELTLIAAASAEIVGRLTRAREQLLSVPKRVGPYLAKRPRDQVETRLTAAIGEALKAVEWRGIRAGEA